jgi:pimeloyl-ACP methyl ester carboxylesterase
MPGRNQAVVLGIEGIGKLCAEVLTAGSRAEVIKTLQCKGFNVVASQLPLTSFIDDVRTVKRDLVGLHGPTVVVGHSYGGAVITQATSAAANVVGLVYVIAFVPDTRETIDSIRTQYPPLPSAQYFAPVDPSETPRFLIAARSLTAVLLPRRRAEEGQGGGRG